MMCWLIKSQIDLGWQITSQKIIWLVIIVLDEGSTE